MSDNLRKKVINFSNWGLFVSFVLFSVPCFGKAENKWYQYEPVVVELDGTIVEETKYGPPNFGETPERDQKVKIYVLRLDDPINVKGKSEGSIDTASHTGIEEIQLVHFVHFKNKINWKNKIVKVKGTLFQSDNAYHYTDVLLSIATVSSK